MDGVEWYARDYQTHNHSYSTDLEQWLLKDSGKIYLHNHDFHSIRYHKIEIGCTYLLAHNRSVAGVREALDSRRIIMEYRGIYIANPDVLTLALLMKQVTMIQLGKIVR